jgi:Uma2 family endonuclease
MALPKPNPDIISEAEYLAFEEHSNTKHEYANGRIIAMAGASENHDLITGNTLASLHNQLRSKPCRIHTSDLRVQVRAVGAYRYPDLKVVCGPSEFADTKPQSLINPTLLVEVLSESTAQIDYEYKLAEYKQIPSLQEYLIISQDRPRIQRFLRQAGREEWLLLERAGVDTELHLPSIDCVLALSDVYERVEFDTPNLET